MEKSMNYFEALALLDKVKDGKNVPLYLINKALELTGDLCIPEEM